MKKTCLSGEKLWNRNYILILLCVVFSFMPFITLMTAFPVYVVKVLHGNEQDAGLMNTMFMLGAIIFRPVSGKLVDDLPAGKMTLFSLGFFLFFKLPVHGHR